MSTVPVDRQDNPRSPAGASGTSRVIRVLRTLRAIPPIRLWASLGAVFLAAELYFLARWATSPSFTPVDSGPSPFDRTPLSPVTVRSSRRGHHAEILNAAASLRAARSPEVLAVFMLVGAK